MGQDSRKRVPGSSDKKRKFGRKKRRAKLFCKKNEAVTSSTSNVTAVLSSQSRGHPPAQAISQPPTASSATATTSKCRPDILPSTSRAGTRIISQPSTSATTEQLEKLKIPASRSNQKLKLKSVEAGIIQNRIIDISLLFPGLQEFLVCKACHESVNFSEVDIRGLGSTISITCTKCRQATFIDSSRKVGKKSNAYEINRRSLLAARCLGHGLTGLKTFCGVMDLPTPVSHSNFDIINQELKEASEKVAKESMRAAIQEDCDTETQVNSGYIVSGDGSWRKRGFTSLQGVSSLIRYENGKVVDVAPKQSYCRACELHPESDTEEYREWFAQHQDKCSANHQGSSGKMEVNGIVEMFQRSESTYGVKYENYIGDGDSKVFKAVCDAKPYGENFMIKKKECVGHVQKRMGTRLRNLKASFSGKKLTDGKTIGGRGRLTAQLIDQLTRYYGNAIRGHNDSVEKMSNAIWATFFHKMSTDQKPQHHLCPSGARSWCRWQQAKANKNLKKFKHPSCIPAVIMDEIKPIYEDLTNPELLERCIGGFTQNSNESFNQSIWKLVPKQFFSGLVVLEIGVFIAVVCFNDGKTAFLEIMKTFEVQPGSSAVTWARNSDENRLFWAERQAAEATLEARRAKRKRNHPDDDSYAAGAY